MEKYTIDINCDMGESYGRFTFGNDELIFPYISSCNIACGFHGGDPLCIERTVKNAIAHNVRIGAHPSYPDLAGFGRREMAIGLNELKAILKYQIAALKGMTESMGGKLEYVKPHGALYNSAAKNKGEAETLAKAIKEINGKLALMGRAGSHMEAAAKNAGIGFVPEAFADRRYEADGQLVPRKKNGAIINDPEEAVAQVLSVVKKNIIKTHDGKEINLMAKSICIHGDNPAAIEILKALELAFKKHGIEKRN